MATARFAVNVGPLTRAWIWPPLAVPDTLPEALRVVSVHEPAIALPFAWTLLVRLKL